MAKYPLEDPILDGPKQILDSFIEDTGISKIVSVAKETKRILDELNELYSSFNQGYNIADLLDPEDTSERSLAAKSIENSFQMLMLNFMHYEDMINLVNYCYGSYDSTQLQEDFNNLYFALFKINHFNETLQDGVTIDEEDFMDTSIDIPFDKVLEKCLLYAQVSLQQTKAAASNFREEISSFINLEN